MWYGSLVWRQGRLRPFRRYQPSKRLRNLRRSAGDGNRSGGLVPEARAREDDRMTAKVVRVTIIDA